MRIKLLHIFLLFAGPIFYPAHLLALPVQTDGNCSGPALPPAAPQTPVLFDDFVERFLDPNDPFNEARVTRSDIDRMSQMMEGDIPMAPKNSAFDEILSIGDEFSVPQYIDRTYALYPRSVLDTLRSIDGVRIGLGVGGSIVGGFGGGIVGSEIDQALGGNGYFGGAVGGHVGGSLLGGYMADIGFGAAVSNPLGILTTTTVYLYTEPNITHARLQTEETVKEVYGGSPWWSTGTSGLIPVHASCP